MPLHDFFRRLRTALGRPLQEAESKGVATVPAAEYDASQARLADTQRHLAATEAEFDDTRTLLIATRSRLAVAEQRMAVLESSNRTAVRAIRRFLQDRERLVTERESVELQLSIAVGERATAVGDQQRTIILNDQLLSALRVSDDVRQHLEEENQHLRRRLAEYTASALLAAEPNRGAESARG